MNNEFEKLGLKSHLIKSLDEMGYIKPTEIQSKVLPITLKDKDVIVKANTGSGKTAIFGINLVEKIDVENNNVQGLILTPTRELALQIRDEISSIGLYSRIKVVALYGKEPSSVQKKQLKQRVHIVVGTPGRTLDHIRNNNLDLSSVKYVVLDEADEMLNMGFIEDVGSIVENVPVKRQTMLFSATMNEGIEKITDTYMKNPVMVEIEEEEATVKNIRQCLIGVEASHKYNLLKDLIAVKKINQCIIFCDTKKAVSELASRMRKDKFSVNALHGDMEQKDRIKTLDDYKAGLFTFIVATDVAARGIHVGGVTQVINYDVPMEAEAYVHRIGRTGRAGNEGEAITFVTPRDGKFLSAIEEYIEMKIPVIEPPTSEEIEENKGKVIRTKKVVKSKNEKNLKIYLSAGKKKKLRRGDIVGKFVKEFNIPMESIGVIDIYDYHTYVDILDGYGYKLLGMKIIDIKGIIINVEVARE
ncbi:ATP-dependent RNA helicase DbpA [Hathewaya proteolytica DSM 3090]|uniref:ATP-dependent RNA helicase DbpA n=1 Tax=Hathewaya proteolytica DSM 3090 TaxID=1121331 RepID=A0A1M6JLH7_9CLOT|nr:DEAD/DEAH box helicase [Hathewaya proteolytica]SHJ47500.1 ATP-dependent RNA helicase DbpA [Hathewaya proteolytica DSM 3090]